MFFDFFFNDTATTEIYTLSLHDALPIFSTDPGAQRIAKPWGYEILLTPEGAPYAAKLIHVEAGKRLSLQIHDTKVDRKSTRLNSSHANISYAVFCLKKKTTGKTITTPRW